MVASISSPGTGGSTSLLLLQQAAKRAPATQAQAQNQSAVQTPIDQVISQIEKTDPDKAAELRKKKDDADSLLQRMQSSKQDIAAQKKEAARQKIQQLKQQLQALRLSSGDPKATARQAARLAKELAQAVKDYSGGGASAGAAAAPVAAAPAAANPAATATGTAAATAATAQTPATAQATDAAAQAPAPVAADTSASLDTAGAQTAAQQATQASPDASATDKAKAAAAGVKPADTSDEDFARDVRRMMSELKNILKSAKEKLQRQSKNAGGLQDVASGEKSLGDAEKMLQKMLGDGTPSALAAANAAMSSTTSAAQAPAATPSVNILV